MIIDKNRYLNRLKDFSSWNEGKSDDEKITLLEYATFVTTPDILFAMDALLSPEIIHYEGGVFIKDKFDKEIYSLWKAKNLSILETEKVMNHIHLKTVLQSDCDDFEVARQSAHIICKFWNVWFAKDGLEACIFGDNLDSLAVTLFHKA